MRAFLICAVLCALAGESSARAGGDPQAEFGAARDAAFYKPHPYSVSATSEAALEQFWSLVEARALAGARATPANVQKALGALDPDLDTDVEGLGNGLTLITADYSGFGTVFLMKADGANSQILWDVRHLSPGDLARYPALSAWTARAALSGCRRQEIDGAMGRCGPIHAGGGALPADDHGDTRFYLDATYAQDAGGTLGGQLSIWSWDGTHVQLSLAKDYLFFIDSPRTRRQDDLLIVREKKEFRSFFACDGCRGRDMDWTIRIDAKGVTDLGETNVRPELDLLDRTIARLHRHRSVGAFADMRAMPALRALAQSLENRWTMLDEDELRHTTQGTDLCFAADGTDLYVLSFTQRADGLVISQAAKVPWSSGPGPGCKGFVADY
jgi:hypothetical protein